MSAVPSSKSKRDSIRRLRLHPSDPSDTREAIFGSFDGMTSTLGVVAGLLATKSNASHIVAGAIGIAVAATIGMGGGQYLSDGQRNLRKAMVMAVATLIGSVLPALPFFFGASTACVVASIDHVRAVGDFRAPAGALGRLPGCRGTSAAPGA